MMLLICPNLIYWTIGLGNFAILCAMTSTRSRSRKSRRSCCMMARHSVLCRIAANNEARVSCRSEKNRNEPQDEWRLPVRIIEIVRTRTKANAHAHHEQPRRSYTQRACHTHHQRPPEEPPTASVDTDHNDP